MGIITQVQPAAKHLNRILRKRRRIKISTAVKKKKKKRDTFVHSAAGQESDLRVTG